MIKKIVYKPKFSEDDLQVSLTIKLFNPQACIVQMSAANTNGSSAFFETDVQVSDGNQLGQKLVHKFVYSCRAHRV